MIYTAGELAKLLGVTARTVRFYDEKRLLIPCGYSKGGYRLYNEDSARRLQKIIMLRFLDFSLEQIQKIMQEESLDLTQSLEEQESLLLEKKEHIERMIVAVRDMKTASKEQVWEHMRRIVDITKEREAVIQQYIKDDNLKKRISIHDYSTADIGFYPWMFSKIRLEPNMKILDIGCGNGEFWKKVASMLPQELEIHMVDYSDGMLESAKRTIEEIQAQYPEKKLKFVVEKRDAANFSYPVKGFDRIMANHMLYHIDKDSRLKLYGKIKELLTDKGRFSCSLIGREHLKELHEFVKEYYPEIKVPSAGFDLWLENASEELRDYFKVIEMEEQKNDLMVPHEEMIFEYISSYSKQAGERISQDKELFLKRVRFQMNQDGYMFIHKATGIIICE